MSRRSRHRGHGAVHGVVIVDKPAGPTSHDLVAQARRHFGTRRVGHAGTLDPAATGVLVLLLGEGTKLSAYLTRAVKTYEAEVVFGSATTTLDAEGQVTRRRILSPGWLTSAALEQALLQERSRQLQVPPAVSAIKVEGRRAHARTREGEDVQLAPRDVKVHEARVLSFDDACLKIELTVSKGYYVRAFARDLGDALGVPAHLGKLRRTRSGPFTLADVCPFPPVSQDALLSLANAVRRSMTTAELTPTGAERARRGQSLTQGEDYDPPTHAPGAPPFEEATYESVALLQGGQLLALAEPLSPQTLKILRGIHDPGDSPCTPPNLSARN